MRKRLIGFSGLLALVGVVAGTTSVDAQQALTISNEATLGLNPATHEVSLASTAATEGFVLAISFDSGAVAVTNLDTTGTATDSASAELVVGEILAGGFTLGVVVDAAAPFDGQTIPAPGGLLARFTASPLAFPGTGNPDIVTCFTFTDGVLNNPPLDNIIVQGGLSIGAGQGLGLNDGCLSIGPPPPDSLTIEDGSGPSDGCGDVRILMKNDSGAVQGFVLAVSHDPLVLNLDDISIGAATAAAGAEFVVPNLAPGGGAGGTLGVVLDFNAPFAGQTIPLGVNQHIATFTYCCKNIIVEPAPATVHAVTFVNGVLGSPPLDNVIVVGGLSVQPDLNNGTFTCLAVPPPPVEDTVFVCAGPGNEGQDPQAGFPPIEGFAGGTVEVCFYYTEADGQGMGEPGNIQGLQIAVEYDCFLTFKSFDITGTIFDEVGAEFVNWNIDDDPNDGDGCEFVAGILLDALPPFDNQTVPPTATTLLIGCAEVNIDPDAPCDSILTVIFQNDINGAGNVAIENIVIINFQSIQDFKLVDCVVVVRPEPEFRRGDCNDDDKVDLADAASILGQQFQGLDINCPDACDANDDGKVNLADSVFILNWLFKMGDAPPNPGPDMDGPDRVEDELPECENGSDCP